MIRVFTSTCPRDRGIVERLVVQLRQHLDVDHYLFVEARDRDGFVGLVSDDHLLVKPDGGDNGMGKGGAIMKWHCYQQMRESVGDDDTFVNLDSDIVFQDLRALVDLACVEGEMKGFVGPDFYVDGRPYRHVSGMVFAAHGRLFREAWGVSGEELSGICDRIVEGGTCPSEDVVSSFLYQRAGGKVVDLNDKWTRGGGREFSVGHLPVGA